MIHLETSAQLTRTAYHTIRLHRLNGVGTFIIGFVIVNAHSGNPTDAPSPLCTALTLRFGAHKKGKEDSYYWFKLTRSLRTDLSVYEVGETIMSRRWMFDRPDFKGQYRLKTKEWPWIAEDVVHG
jgi:hypothetical protein